MPFWRVFTYSGLCQHTSKHTELRNIMRVTVYWICALNVA